MVDEPVLCDDDNPCTEDSCTPQIGCESTPLPVGTACSDEDPCTVGDVCSAGLCTPGTVDPACAAPPTSICPLVGSAGEEVVCTVKMSRQSETTGFPAAAQFVLNYPADAATLLEFTDELCPAGATTCFDAAVPPAALYPSGHSLALAPANPSDWAGSGVVVLSNPAAPTAVLTDTTLPNSTTLFQVHMQLEAELEPGSAYLTIDGGIASTPSAQPLGLTVQDEVLLITGGTCESAEDCESPEECTEVSCSGGQCLYTQTTAPCDDCLLYTSPSPRD